MNDHKALFVAFLLFIACMAFMAMAFTAVYEKPCTLPTAPVGTLSW